MKKVSENISQTDALLRQIAERDKLLSIIAHNLKSRIGFTDSIASYLVSDYFKLNDIERLQFLKTLSTETNLLSELFDNLTVWTNLILGKLEFEPIKLNLKSIIEFVTEQFITTAEDKGIKIELKKGKDVFALADENMTIVIIKNLLSNALKFSRSGSKIIIICKKISNFTEIIIEDYGNGIKKSDFKKLFKIRENYRTNGTAGESGTGLGLIICKQFAEKNGGNLNLESIFRKGTKAVCRLPQLKKDKNIQNKS